MAKSNVDLQDLIERARTATLGRRKLLHHGAIGATAAAFATRGQFSAAAQDATPAGEVVQSITREEYNAKLAEVYPETADAPQGGTFILGDSSDISTTNGILINNSPTSDVMGLVFETLVNSDATEAGYVPGLADRWEISADGLTYTYYLNQAATWHDGTPFTADDVIFSFDAQSNPDTSSSYTGSFNDTVASWEKVDDHTVVVTAAAVIAPIVFFGNSYCPIMPKHLWEDVPLAEWAADGGSIGQDPARVVGTGPFKFVEWVQGERVELAKNETYYDKVPNIDTFTFLIWPDQISAIEALRAGDIDAFEGTPPADTQSLIDDESIEVSIFDTYNFTFYGYNMDPAKTTLFQEKEVRQALFYALDRESVLENIQLGYGIVAQGTQGILSQAYAPDQMETQYSFDIAKANELLDGAGWVAGDDGVRAKDGTRLAFEVMYTAGIAIYDQLVPYMQEAWAEIGVEMTPNGVDFGAVLIPAITETFDYEIALLGFSWDVTGDQSAMFSSDAYMVGFNFMRYANPEVDRLNDEANVELDPAVRTDLLIQSSNLVNEDLPVGIFWFSRNRDAYNVRIHDWNPNGYAGLLWSLPYTWIEE